MISHCCLLELRSSDERCISKQCLLVLGLTVFVGVSTGIGSLLGFMSKNFNPKFLAGALGFSTGVMVYVSLVQIFVKARVDLSNEFRPKAGYLHTVIAFFAGVAGIMLYISLDELQPTAEEYGGHHNAIGRLIGGMAGYVNKSSSLCIKSTRSPNKIY